MTKQKSPSIAVTLAIGAVIVLATIGTFNFMSWLGRCIRHTIAVFKQPETVQEVQLRLEKRIDEVGNALTKQVNDVRQHAGANFTFGMDRIEWLERAWRSNVTAQLAGDAKQDARLAALEGAPNTTNVIFRQITDLRPYTNQFGVVIWLPPNDPVFSEP